MTPERLATIKASLDKRQTDLTVVMENVRKPHNLAAVARTLEAVGGLEIHAITELTSIRLTQMSAGGTKKWIKVNKHPSSKQGLDDLKQRGFQIIATSIDENARDYRDIDYSRLSAILVGEELEGLQFCLLAGKRIKIGTGFGICGINRFQLLLCVDDFAQALFDITAHIFVFIKLQFLW